MSRDSLNNRIFLNNRPETRVQSLQKQTQGTQLSTLDFFYCWVFCALLISLAGCAGTHNALSSWNANRSRPEKANTIAATSQLEAPIDSRYLSDRQASLIESKTKHSTQNLSAINQKNANSETKHSEIQPVSHEPALLPGSEASKAATLTVEGRTYRVLLVEEADENSRVQSVTTDSDLSPTHSLAQHATIEEHENTLQLNLPTALSMVGGQHPAVGFAQWRVQEAYARWDQANVLWLPSLQAGFGFHKHDGNYQASDGTIVDVNRNSFQYGLGAGATGAGTTPRPGIVAQFHLADAIFQPEIAEKTVWARGHAASGVINQQLLNVSVAYLELLNAEQDLRIVEESHIRTSDLSKLTGDFAAAGQGLQADADRLETELRLVENRLASGRERVAVASARLSQALSIDAGQRIVPLDPTVVPIELVSMEMDKGSLISTGLSNRPELKEAQALVAVACEQYKRQKYAPFVPSILLGLSTGGFGGGTGNNLANVNGRYDADALMTWEVRNLGFGEASARRETEARIQQAQFENIRIMDQVAREIAEAHSQVIHRTERIQITQQAIESAENSYQLNLNRIRDGQGLPLEVLQSVQALEDARRAYLSAVVDHNEAQFRLQWALGWSVFPPCNAFEEVENDMNPDLLHVM